MTKKINLIPEMMKRMPKKILKSEVKGRYKGYGSILTDEELKIEANRKFIKNVDSLHCKTLKRNENETY